MNNTGCELHIAVQSDPLGLGAIRLDTGEWAISYDSEEPPKPGQRVIVVREDGTIYWIGAYEEIISL